MNKNKHGVFIDSEIISLIDDGKLRMEIRVGEHNKKWGSSSSCSMSMGGYGSPLTQRDMVFNSRKDALYKELSYVDTWLKKIIKEYPRYKKYDRLIPIWKEPVQLELF